MEKARPYARVDQLLLKRNSSRRIARAPGVARNTIAKRVKKAAAAAPPLPCRRSKKAQRHRWEALELDERWPFVGRKKRKVWRGLTVERARRRTVAWGLGSRDPATGQCPWQALPRR